MIEQPLPPAWPPESSLSVSEAIQEAMEASPQNPRANVESPADLPAPQPHLPLRRASAQHLQSKARSAPKPLFMASSHFHKVKGFNPTPVQPLPYVDNFTASSEHAFAPRDVRRPSRLPLAALENRGIVLQSARNDLSYPDEHRRPPSSPLAPPSKSPESLAHSRPRELKSSRSVGSGLRSLGSRNSRVNSYESQFGHRTPDSLSVRPGWPGSEQVRESFRSAMTSNSSVAHLSSVHTERSSLTCNSSTSDFVKIQPDDWQDADMSVEDAIGMYEDGFESAKPSPAAPVDLKFLTSGTRYSNDGASIRTVDRPASQSRTQNAPKRPFASHRRSQSASLLLGISKSARPGASPTPNATSQTGSGDPALEKPLPNTPYEGAPPSNRPVPRDRYGFKKASQHITVEQYDAWDTTYRLHLERRSAKWHTMMRSYGFSTSTPFRFPPKSDKIKRYVRKGIPPEFRGAAWFWYAGGPGKLKQEGGRYWRLVEKAEKGELSDNDREHIERDLNRTFPDNARFKPDPTSMEDAQAGAGGGGRHGNEDMSDQRKKVNKSRRSNLNDPETPIIASLRRVLQAFAIHNPNIGYCQSLNFIAGLLLLFLDQDEEKSFILLNIITSTHLPGTHGVALEGANVDIAVLMSCIKDSLPAVWAKLDDKPTLGAPMTGGSAGALRLPTVSLATTAWFMSLFVGTLPIECVLRVWDCLFFEGSKTLFRIALAIFKFGEPQILAVSDPMEIFQVVQTLPRGLLDINALMEVCFRRRGGFGGVSQGLIEARREERRGVVKGRITGEIDDGDGVVKRMRERWRRGTFKA